jgi:hypothetical protein
VKPTKLFGSFQAGRYDSISMKFAQKWDAVIKKKADSDPVLGFVLFFITGAASFVRSEISFISI